jgi:hypothetical protein
MLDLNKIYNMDCLEGMMEQQNVNGIHILLGGGA